MYTPQLIKSKGFTLIEVLVAMILFAIGMLGLAAMQGIALRDNNDAYLRSQAVFLAYEMGDRIKANPNYWDTLIIQDAGSGAATLAAASTTVTGYSDNYNFCSNDDPPGGGVVGAATPGMCTATQLALYDWYRWRDDVITRLPGGGVTITRVTDPDDATGYVLRLVITWDLTNTEVSAVVPSFTYDVRP